MYTPLAVVSRARKTLCVSTTAGIEQIPAVSSKEGAVIGAILSTRNKIHRGHHGKEDCSRVANARRNCDEPIEDLCWTGYNRPYNVI
jgi:hypothetical protein